MKFICLLVLSAVSCCGALVFSTTGDPCSHNSFSISSGYVATATKLQTTVLSEFQPGGNALINEACGVTIAGSIFTVGPIRPGFIELISSGSVEGNMPGGSASFSLNGTTVVSCGQSCLPLALIPVQLGVELFISTTATGSRMGTSRGASGLIQTKIRIYENVTLTFENNFQFQTTQDIQIFLEDPSLLPSAVPEPSTFTVAAGALAALAFCRKANPKP